MSIALWLVPLAPVLFPVDNDPPRARIDFPLPSALTDAEAIRVRGTARDSDGVASVRIKGIPASTVNGFATWWAVVPLELGENELSVETLDLAGNLDPSAALTVVRRDGVIVRRPQGLALDPDRGTCFVFDWVPDGALPFTQTRIVAADLETGALAVVSSRSKGSGPLPRYATGEMDHDPVGQRLLLIAITEDILLEVDLATGDRSVVSGGGVGAGPPLQGAVGLELDPEHDRAWVCNQSIGPTSGALLGVDLTSGARWIVSSSTIGNGPWPMYQRWMRAWRTATACSSPASWTTCCSESTSRAGTAASSRMPRRPSGHPGRTSGTWPRFPTGARGSARRATGVCSRSTSPAGSTPRSRLRRRENRDS